MAITNYTDFVNNYLVKNGMIGNAANMNKAPDQLKIEIDEINAVVATKADTLDGALLIPIGTTLERPLLNEDQVAIRFNTDTDVLEEWNGTEWINIATGLQPTIDGALLIPIGTTLERPLLNEDQVAIRFNTDTDVLEEWNGTEWRGLTGSGGSFEVITKPIITSPANGTTNFTGTLTCTYATTSSYDKAQDYVEWQIASDSAFTNILNSYTGTNNLTSFTPSVSLPQQLCYARVKQGSDGHRSAWSESITFTTPNIYVETPTITVEGTPSNVPETPILTGSAFSVFNGTSTHVSTDWVIENNGVVIWSSLANTTNKLTITVPAGFLVESTLYTFKVKYNSSTYGSSTFGSTTGTTKSQFFDYDSGFGGELEGGYYAGKIQRADGVYALIVAPKALGTSKLAWKNAASSSGGCKSLNDGAANTAHMVANGDATVYPAAHYCNNLVINGYSDWYLPARDELDIAYRNLKPTTDSNNTDSRTKSSYVYTLYNDVSGDKMGVNRHSVPAGVAYTTSNPAQTTLAAFKQGGAESFYTDTNSRHWSSTEYGSTLAWIQSFSGTTAGDQNNYGMLTTFFVRAFRAVKIS